MLNNRAIVLEKQVREEVDLLGNIQGQAHLLLTTSFC